MKYKGICHHLNRLEIAESDFIQALWSEDRVPWEHAVELLDIIEVLDTLTDNSFSIVSRKVVDAIGIIMEDYESEGTYAKGEMSGRFCVSIETYRLYLIAEEEKERDAAKYAIGNILYNICIEMATIPKGEVLSLLIEFAKIAEMVHMSADDLKDIHSGATVWETLARYTYAFLSRTDKFTDGGIDWMIDWILNLNKRYEFIKSASYLQQFEKDFG